MLAPHTNKEERRLSKVKIDLMRHKDFAFWSGIMMMGRTEVRDDIPTAATDGCNEYYGRAFINRLDNKMLGFVILHENMHKAFRHLTTWQKLYKEDRRLANMACDYVINLMLVDMDPNENVIAFPRTVDGERIGLLDRQYAGMDTKQVFDMLKQQKQDNPDGDGGKGDGGDGDGAGLDDHDWEAAERMSEEEVKTLEKEVDQALRQGIIAQGRLNGDKAGGMPRELADLLKPQVDWREVLKEFVKSICNAKDASSWRRVNRRFLSADTYMPTLIGERVGRIVIGVDTSGSIGGKQITTFLSEVCAIAQDVKPSHIDLIYWDAAVASHEEYDEASVANIVTSTKPMGGGGTDPTCLMRYVREKMLQPECIIMLTDGYIGSWGTEWEAPVLWVIANNNNDITAPNGKTVHIKE